MDILVYYKYMFHNLIKKIPLLLVLLELMLRRMPFGLCNAPATFQRCMTAIFSDFCEKIVEVFMDDFYFYGKSYDDCLSNLDCVLQRCEQTNLVLNWEKCHFMGNEGIVLGHKFLKEVLRLIKPRLMLLKRCHVLRTSKV